MALNTEQGGRETDGGAKGKREGKKAHFVFPNSICHLPSLRSSPCNISSLLPVTVFSFPFPLYFCTCVAVIRPLPLLLFACMHMLPPLPPPSPSLPSPPLHVRQASLIIEQGGGGRKEEPPMAEEEREEKGKERRKGGHICMPPGLYACIERDREKRRGGGGRFRRSMRELSGWFLFFLRTE